MAAPLRDELESLVRAASVLRRQWPLLMGGLLLGVGGGFVHAARQTPVYSATAQVAIGNEPWRSMLPGDLMPSSPYSERMTFDTQPLVIQSAPVAVRAAANLGWSPEQASAIRGAVSVSKIEGTRVFTISAEGSDGARAEGIANAVADAYIQVTTENRAKSARDSIRWLETQLADYEQKVQHSHQAMIDYVERESLTRGSVAVGGTPGALPLLEKLRHERAEAELELDRLTGRYGERHPELIEKSKEVQRLAAKIAAEEQTLRTVQKKNIGYDILAGRAKADPDLYGVLARKLEQANISSSLAESAISVVQYASAPPRPVRPNPPRIVVMAAVAGLLFGMGSGFLREALDKRIIGAQQLVEVVEAPLLGSLPDVSADEQFRGQTALKVFSPTATAGSEAFRALRANVKFAMVGLKRNIVVVTSCQPGEGKSMVTANLAAALVGSGQRVVVVDADLRRPTQHRYRGLKVAPRGLSTLIAGEDKTVDSIIVSGGTGEPDLVLAGPTPPNPGDFLDSPILHQALTVLSQRYDLVLVDSPPGDLFADSQVLGQHAGGVLVVSRAGVAERGGLTRMVAQLRRGGCKILGCVLNGVDPTDLSYYGAAYGYAEDRAETVLDARDATNARVG